MNKTVSKVYLASDHRGVGLKLYLTEMLNAAGYAVVNLGVDDPNTSVDYPDVAATLADAMLGDEKSRGVIICGTGAGVQIASNRYRHLRATRVDRPDQARADRTHNDINVLALGADDIDIEVAYLCVQAFLETPFDASERRVRRIEKIS
ncbi:RpiB/LacA/LacB family sugar-phosphate isomerase [bacterium]|nr:RpiB/LacA/LacB family sugar-phosphate isomerase [bacterium]